MKKFLLKTLTFALVAYSATLALDYFFSKASRSSICAYFRPMNETLDGGIDAEILAIGNSRGMHLDVEIMERTFGAKAYNISRSGSPFNRQIHHYNLYRAHNRKPRIILQAVDMWTLRYETGYCKEEFYPFFWEKEVRDEFFPEEPFTFAEKYIPLYRYDIEKVKAYTRRKPYPQRDTSYQIWDGRPWMKPGTTHSFEIDDRTLSCFEDYLKQTKEEGIKLVFVHAPLYNAIPKMTTNMDEMYAFFKETARKYDIPFLDYMQMDFCDDTTFFANALHLNDKGCRIFTDSVARHVLRLGLDE